MLTLRVDILKPGMRVAEPVFNPQNVKLLNAGTELTGKNIVTLKQWGVSRVMVEAPGADDTLDGFGCSAAETAAITDALSEKFLSVSHDPVMAEIQRVAGMLIQQRQAR